MEISDKKRAASQANGRKSKGPKTPEGKRASSRNALRHGILADTILIEGESRERFISFYKSLVQELAPQGLSEELLAERAAVDIGGVEQRNPAIERLVDDRPRAFDAFDGCTRPCARRIGRSSGPPTRRPAPPTTKAL